MHSDKFNYISISGSGRSGTNITKKMLSLHPDVFALPFEYRFTIDPNGIIELYNTLKYCWSPYVVHERIRTFDDFLSRIGRKKYIAFLIGKIIKAFDKNGHKLTPPKYPGWELEKWFPNYLQHLQNLKMDLIDFKYKGSWPGETSFQLNNKMNFVAYKKNLPGIFRKFLTGLYNDALIQNGKRFFVEDNTWSILFAPDLLDIMPETKMIHIYRDPRDVVSSFMKQRWTPANLEENIIYYASVMDRIIEVHKNINPGKILNIRFEELVREQERVIQEICEFCELSFNEKMLKLDLSKNNIGRWEIDFDQNQRRKINMDLDYYIKFFEY